MIEREHIWILHDLRQGLVEFNFGLLAPMLLVFGNLGLALQFADCVLEHDVLPLECLGCFPPHLNLSYRLLELLVQLLVVLLALVKVLGKLDGLLSEPVDGLFQEHDLLCLLHIQIKVTCLLFVIDHLNLDPQHMVLVTGKIVSLMLLYDSSMQCVQLCDHILHVLICPGYLLAIAVVVLAQ